MHQRRWCLSAASSPEDLAEKVTGHIWTLCTAFYVEGHPSYLFLNDSTSEDAVVEFGVVKRFASGHAQIESITFGWTTCDRAVDYIRAILSGEYDHQMGRALNLEIDTPEAHDCCL